MVTHVYTLYCNHMHGIVVHIPNIFIGGSQFQYIVRSYFQQNELLIYFCHICDIKSQFSYLICSYMRRLAIQNSLKCMGTLQIFIVPHWYFILDTGLILRSFELFIYIQTCANINAYMQLKNRLSYDIFIPFLQSDLRCDK